jgi:hypothetical protein
MYYDNMRTTLTLDDDVHELAAMYARAKGITLGAAVGELVRKGQAAPAEIRHAANGFPLFPRRGRRITSAMVKEALEEE